MRRRGAPQSILVLALALLFAVPGCGKSNGAAFKVEVRVLARSGGVATEQEMRNALAVVDLALGEMGIEERYVVPLADGRLRVEIPPSQSGRSAEVLARLRDPKLGVELPE